MNYKKIQLPLTVGVILTLAITSQIANANFNDIGEGDTYYDATGYGQTEGIITGYSDGTFKPENKINRAEFLKIVIGANFKATDINSCLTSSTKLFKDTPTTAWYAKYLCVAKNNSIIGGYPDGTFKPDQNINFAEASKIITVAKNGHDMGSSLSSSTEWYKKYVTYLATNKDVPATIKNLEYQITRGEMMEMIYRLNKNITNKFSLSYDQVAGSQSSCKKAGETAGGYVKPPTNCCAGLSRYGAQRVKGVWVTDTPDLCLEPTDSLNASIKIMNTANECTSNKDLGQTLDPAPYKNANFAGYSFPMKSFKANCAARCDVNPDKNTAEIGWMCTMSS